MGIAGLLHNYAEVLPKNRVLNSVRVMSCSDIKEYSKNQQLSCTKNVFPCSSEHHDPENTVLQFEARGALLPCSNMYFGEMQMCYLYLGFFSVVILRQ